MFMSGCGHRPPPSPSEGRAFVYTATATIGAPAAEVWSVIVDTSAYSDWNPWLISAEGAVDVGSKVHVEVVLDGKTRWAKHVVLVADEPHRMCWRDAGWTTAFVRAERCRTLVPASGGTRIEQELTIYGAFAKSADRRYGDAMRAGIVAETNAIKQRVER